MFHRGCDLFKTVGDEDTVQRILNLFGLVAVRLSIG